jgi:hypothetical protein
MVFLLLVNFDEDLPHPVISVMKSLMLESVFIHLGSFLEHQDHIPIVYTIRATMTMLIQCIELMVPLVDPKSIPNE